MPQSDVTKQLLFKLLSASSPELGARLKQRLSAAFFRQGLGEFNEKQQGFRKFADYLESTHGDLIKIERPKNAGDILVSLRDSLIHAEREGISANLTPSKSPRVRNDIWQAFTNPDTNRKRFLRKQSKAVLHYLLDEESEIRKEVQASPDSFFEIEPISPNQQKTWMDEFLGSIQISPDERTVLEAVINEPYTSTVNTTFARALGGRGAAWKEYRTNKVVSHIMNWAKDHGIAFDQLCAPASSIEQASHLDQKGDEVIGTNRERALRLLELLDDADIGTLVIPTLLSVILIKSRS